MGNGLVDNTLGATFAPGETFAQVAVDTPFTPAPVQSAGAAFKLPVLGLVGFVVALYVLEHMRGGR